MDFKWSLILIPDKQSPFRNAVSNVANEYFYWKEKKDQQLLVTHFSSIIEGSLAPYLLHLIKHQCSRRTSDIYLTFKVQNIAKIFKYIDSKQLYAQSAYYRYQISIVFGRQYLDWMDEFYSGRSQITKTGTRCWVRRALHWSLPRLAACSTHGGVMGLLCRWRPVKCFTF